MLGNISNSKGAPSSSIETLSKELDDRIAKIKQKYYESGEGSRWRVGEADCSLQERKVNNYVG